MFWNIHVPVITYITIAITRRGVTIHPDTMHHNVTMCIVGMCDSRSAHQKPSSYASNAIEQFEHQRSKSAQPIKYIKSLLTDRARSQLMHIISYKWLHDLVITVKTSSSVAFK